MVIIIIMTLTRDEVICESWLPIKGTAPAIIKLRFRRSSVISRVTGYLPILEVSGSDLKYCFMYVCFEYSFLSFVPCSDIYYIHSSPRDISRKASGALV